ncbi:metallophosphoesterase [Cellulomonas sp. JZ18]|uniref:metallophosphoesterase n=1 Tax=Cellulomonas sp. JZ18 TaxID=2654191 RepID=UPI0012D44793|nr:metallophosphoesterase [Cellulomonas sp. JZ18]QGQ18998.1 metallophosphoesterase [Cellulomonas sp. JZ18]
MDDPRTPAPQAEAPAAPTPWWRRPLRLRWPRASTLVLAVLAVVASVVFGVTTASVQASLGPHLARYDVTTDATVTIDLGPLGTLQIDSPLPLTLGARATVQEIPAQFTEVDEATTLQALGDDLTSYLQFFAGPEAAVRDVVVALVADAAARSLLALVVLVVVWWTGRLLLGAARRAELAARLGPYRRPAVAAGLAVVTGATVLTSSVAPPDRPSVRTVASAVFEGTPLAGARVTGRLGGVIDTYGGYAVDAWRRNEEFYATADEALAVAWADRQEQDARAAEDAAPTPGASPDDPAADPAADPTAGGATDPAADPVADPVADAGAGAAGQDAPQEGATDGAGVPGATATATATAAGARPSDAATQDEVEPVVLLVVSDLHCNVGMAPLVGTLARLADVDAVLDAGDTTMNGTSVEQYCVTSFARAVPAGVPLVTSPGNHDSADTSRRYARAGATVLDGSVVDVAGVRVLGDRDVNETRVGGGTTSAVDETPGEASRRLAEVACDARDVDLLLIHTPTVGDDALEDGCVPAQVSGHYHRRVGPEQVGRGVRFISSSTAGATLGEPTVGPLRGAAEMTLLRFDPRERRFLDVQVVQVSPDATVRVLDRQPWPEPAPEPGSGDDPEREDGPEQEDGAQDGLDQEGGSQAVDPAGGDPGTATGTGTGGSAGTG